MNKRIGLLAVLLGVVLTLGCNLKENQLNKRLARWDKMSAKGEDPRKMYDFARQSIYFFLVNEEFQRTKETEVTEQERLIFHRRMTSMQVFMLDYHAARALEAVERPDPDWKAGAQQWIMADTCARGRLPGYPTQFSLVHVQSGYEAMIEDLVIHPEKYYQMTRDFPGLMSGIRKMSRYKYLEGERELAAGHYDMAINDYLLVFTHDIDNFPAADKRLRQLTGRGVKQTVALRFMQNRYLQTFLSDRADVHGNTAARLQNIAEEQGQEAADSALYEVAEEVGSTYNITPEQDLDMYYYMQAYHNGNLPEYLRMWRHVVLEGQKPLKPRYAD